MKKALSIVHLVVCFLVLFCLVAGVQADSANNDGAQYEIVFWESVKDSQDPRLFQSYLKKYPNGVFAEIARLSIEKYGGSPAQVVAPLPEKQAEVSPPIATVRSGSSALYKVALFPWNLMDDADYMRSILTDEVLRTIERYGCIELSHSYYTYNRKYGIKNLNNGNSKKLNKRQLWRNSKPQVDYVAEYGQALGVDAVLIGTMRVTNPWSDRYKLGYIRIFIIDLRSKSVVKVQNISTNRDASAELPILMGKAVGQFSDQFCNSQ